jgi:hypothetical protein
VPPLVSSSITPPLRGVYTAGDAYNDRRTVILEAVHRLLPGVSTLHGSPKTSTGELTSGVVDRLQAITEINERRQVLAAFLYVYQKEVEMYLVDRVKDRIDSMETLIVEFLEPYVTICNWDSLWSSELLCLFNAIHPVCLPYLPSQPCPSLPPIAEIVDVEEDKKLTVLSPVTSKRPFSLSSEEMHTLAEHVRRMAMELVVAAVSKVFGDHGPDEVTDAIFFHYLDEKATEVTRLRKRRERVEAVLVRPETPPPFSSPPDPATSSLSPPARPLDLQCSGCGMKKKLNAQGQCDDCYHTWFNQPISDYINRIQGMHNKKKKKKKQDAVPIEPEKKQKKDEESFTQLQQKVAK